MKEQPSRQSRLETLVEEGKEGSIAGTVFSSIRGSSREVDVTSYDASMYNEKDEPSFSVDNTNVEHEHTDETLRLFECMPKGFANSLEFGPCRRVSDSMDYEKMCILQKKKLDYLKEKQIPLNCRARYIHEKALELQNHIKNFEHLIDEVSRRTRAAEKLYQQCSLANRELLNELPRANKLLELELMRRDAIIERVTKYEKVKKFIERLLKMTENQFDGFSAIMDRNQTLITTNNYLMKKYLNRHQVQEKLSEEVQSIKILDRTHSICLRQELAQLKKELAAKIRANIDMEQKCLGWSETMTDRLLMEFKLTMCITNMAESIVRVRPYVARKLEQVVEPGDQIRAVGAFIVDYTDIIKRLKSKKRFSMLPNARYSRAALPNDF